MTAAVRCTWKLGGDITVKNPFIPYVFILKVKELLFKYFYARIIFIDVHFYVLKYWLWQYTFKCNLKGLQVKNNNLGHTFSRANFSF